MDYHKRQLAGHTLHPGRLAEKLELDGLIGKHNETISADIRQIPGGFETRIALLTGSGKGKLPSSRARSDRSRQLMAPQR